MKGNKYFEGIKHDFEFYLEGRLDCFSFFFLFIYRFISFTVKIFIYLLLFMSLSGFLKDAIYFTVNKYLRKKMTDCILKSISFIIKNIFLFMHLSDLLKGYKYFWGITNILQKKKELIFLG